MVKKKTVNFSSSVSEKSGGMGTKPQFSVPLTTEEKLQNVANNMANSLNEQGNALNAIAFWIAENDHEVQQAGNVTKWAEKLQKERQELKERKEAYERKKDR